jgi:ribosomal protein L32
MTTGIAPHWRLNAQRYRLAGTVCADCGHRIFPPRPVCPACVAHRARADVLDTIQLGSLEPVAGGAEPEHRNRIRLRLAI